MTDSPLFYIALIIVVAVIFGFAKVLSFNFKGIFGGSIATNHLKRMGIDEDHPKEYHE